MLHDAAHKFRHLLMRLVAIGAHRAGEVGRAGDDVARGAAMQLADGNDRRLVGANLARDDGLQGIDDLSGNHDGVVAALGHGTVHEVPRTSIRNQSVLAMRGPGSQLTVPASTSLQMCAA